MFYFPFWFTNAIWYKKTWGLEVRTHWNGHLEMGKSKCCKLLGQQAREVTKATEPGGPGEATPPNGTGVPGSAGCCLEGTNAQGCQIWFVKWWQKWRFPDWSVIKTRVWISDIRSQVVVFLGLRRTRAGWEERGLVRGFVPWSGAGYMSVCNCWWIFHKAMKPSLPNWSV